MTKTVKKRRDGFLFILILTFISLDANSIDKQQHLYPLNSCADNSGINVYFGSVSGLVPWQDLPHDIKHGLLYMREEEKLARDVYTYFFSVFPLRPFENISKSEQAHMDAIKNLIVRYRLSDPAENMKPGEFKNSDLQKLYHSLIKQGAQDKLSALKTAAFIEEKDIRDLQFELKNRKLEQDMIIVYQNLLRASKHHLRVFTGLLKANGEEYIPQILGSDEFYSILKN